MLAYPISSPVSLRLRWANDRKMKKNVRQARSPYEVGEADYALDSEERSTVSFQEEKLYRVSYNGKTSVPVGNIKLNMTNMSTV